MPFITNAITVAPVLQSQPQHDFSLSPAAPAATNSTVVTQVLPEQALEQLLAQNFDRISTPAVITIFKYFSNIVSNPMESKFKSINLTNKVFLDKVKPVKFALEYLASVGFVSSGSSTIVYPSDDTEHLKAQLQLLDGAMNRLQIPMDDRPRLLVASPTDPRMSTVTLAPFDPFKASVVRQASQVRSILRSILLY
jgi:hypothetical protein